MVDANSDPTWGSSSVSDFYSAIGSMDPATAGMNILSTGWDKIKFSLADTQHTFTFSMNGNFLGSPVSVTSMDVFMENGVGYSIGCTFSATQQQLMNGENVNITLNSLVFKNELTGDIYYSLNNINQTFSGNINDSATITSDQYLKGNDTITGNSYNDILISYAGNDALNGQGGHDSLKGMTGNDILYGGAGNDTLIGGAGHDKLYGGLGKDVFLFNTSANTNTNADVIADFSKTQGDKIHLENSLFTHSDFQSVQTVANAAQGTDLIYERSTGKLYYDSDGAGTGSAAQVIATITGKPALSASDLVFV